MFLGCPYEGPPFSLIQLPWYCRPETRLTPMQVQRRSIRTNNHFEYLLIEGVSSSQLN